MKVGYNLPTEPMIHLTIQGRMAVRRRGGVDTPFYLLLNLFSPIINKKIKDVKLNHETNVQYK